MSKKTKLNSEKQSSNKNKKYFIHYKQPNIPVNDFDFCSIENIESIENNSASEIFIQDILEFFTDQDIVDIIKEIEVKLISGGKLYVQGIDAYSICVSMVYKQIDIESFRGLVFSFGKKNIFNLGKILEIFEENSTLKIEQKKFINGLQYFLQYGKA
jgi:hypothetical protein